MNMQNEVGRRHSNGAKTDPLLDAIHASRSERVKWFLGRYDVGLSLQGVGGSRNAGACASRISVGIRYKDTW